MRPNKFAGKENTCRVDFSSLTMHSRKCRSSLSSGQMLQACIVHLVISVAKKLKKKKAKIELKVEASITERRNLGWDPAVKEAIEKG